MASKMGYPERLSIFSSATLNGKDDDYDDLSSPADLLEDGALRRGGASPIFSRESYGLLAQYAAVGLIYGTLPQLVYPFLTVYLNLDGTTTTSATALLSIPWSLKVFIGMLTDNVPVFGYRRRPYMVFGWLLCAVCLFAMGVMHQPASYWVMPEDRKRASNLTESQYAEFGVKINRDAINSGGSYVVLMMFASLGYVIADVAADAVVVEYAQREPESIRGRTQTAIYSVRTVFNIVAQAILAFFLNGPEYGGDFSFSLSVSSLMLILAIVCVPVIPMTWFFIRETRYESRGFKVYIATLWDALKSRAFYQVIAYSFFSGVLSQITYVASLPITNVWLHASPLTVNVTSILGSLVMVFTLIGTGFYGLQWNWRVVIAITMVAVVGIDVVVTMLTVWDHVRTAWFWLGVPIVEQVPQSIGWLVSTFVVVELAGEGNEGACYGLLTTVMNLSQPFASTITKNLNAGFAVWNEDLQADTHHVRTDVTITIMISYACKLLSLALLPMLPRQKAETQDLKRHGGSSRLLGGITIFYCLFALAWSIMTNLFAIYKDTKCLAITGGCKE